MVPGEVDAAQREGVLGQRGCVVWLTGLSASGKSTIAAAFERRMVSAGRVAYVLDGDNVRRGLCGDLGFSPADRDENIRRAGQVAALFADAGVVAVVAFISPYRAARRRAREMVPPGRFVEAFVDTTLEECERRDPKGLYRKARAGEIDDFTGVDAPYEVPASPELRLPTADTTPRQCAAMIVDFLEARGLLSPPTSEGGVTR